jgi:hypothetical protein
MARSLVIPGWGHVAAGDRRGLIPGPVFAAAALLVLVLAWAYASGPAVGAVFVVGTAVTVAWLGQAIHASRRAARRWERQGSPARAGGAGVLVVGTAVATCLAVLFWAMAGEGGSPAARAAAYAAAWWSGRPAEAADDFDPPLDPTAVATAWAEKTPRLRNALVAASADAGPLGGIDPDRPFDSVRFTPLSTVPDPTAGRVVLGVDIVRRVPQPTRILGILPATATGIETVERIGTMTVRLVPGESTGLPIPAGSSWRIEAVDILGTSLGA